MTREEIRKRIVDVGIVPVIRASSPRQALLGAEAVCTGGIPIIEVTMTVPGAIEVISQLVKCSGSDVLIGAGTVTNAEMARKCLDAGAGFIVSPGFDAEMVAFIIGQGIVTMPGALTPTEVMMAWKSGADFIKIFPCGSVGGASYLKALRGPFPDVPFIPTGGVNLTTAGEFLRAGAKALGIGGELVSAGLLQANDSATISSLARKYKAIVTGARQSAVGAISAT